MWQRSASDLVTVAELNSSEAASSVIAVPINYADWMDRVGLAIDGAQLSGQSPVNESLVQLQNAV